MFHSRIRRRAHGNQELNITPFMNVLVVLVSFLLATAVFSHVAKLDMHLPGGGEAGGDVVPPALQLEITVRHDQLEVGDRTQGLMAEIAMKEGKHDFSGLTAYLRRVKEQFPMITEATVLAEENTSYDDIIHTMDAVRVDVHQEAGQWITYELFSQVALGSAVPDPRQAASNGQTP